MPQLNPMYYMLEYQYMCITLILMIVLIGKIMIPIKMKIEKIRLKIKKG